MEIFFFIFIVLGLFLLKLGWYIFCVNRGKRKAERLANDISCVQEDYYALGNPFTKFNGFKNL